jgi:hypothetical protein
VASVENPYGRNLPFVDKMAINKYMYILSGDIFSARILIFRIH